MSFHREPLVPPGSKFRYLWQNSDDEDDTNSSSDANAMAESTDVASLQRHSDHFWPRNFRQNNWPETFSGYRTQPHRTELELDIEAAQRGCFLVSCIRKPEWPNFYSSDPGRALPPVAAAAHAWTRDNWGRLLDDFHSNYPNALIKKKQKVPPTTICAMYADGQIFICSSARKSDSFVELFSEENRMNQLVVKALELADLEEKLDPEAGRRLGHIYQANCAEALTLHLWSVTNQSDDVKLDSFSEITVKEREGGGAEVYAPCNPDGCAILLRGMLVHDVDHLSPGERIRLGSHPYGRLTDEIVPKPSVTETAEGTLWFSCAARCNGIGQYLKQPCICQTRGWYSAWRREPGAPDSWATTVDESLTKKAYDGLMEYLDQYPELSEEI